MRAVVVISLDMPVGMSHSRVELVGPGVLVRPMGRAQHSQPDAAVEGTCCHRVAPWWQRLGAGASGRDWPRVIQSNFPPNSLDGCVQMGWQRWREEYIVAGAIAMRCPPTLHKCFLPGVVASAPRRLLHPSVPGPGVLPMPGRAQSPCQGDALPRPPGAVSSWEHESSCRADLACSRTSCALGSPRCGGPAVTCCLSPHCARVKFSSRPRSVSHLQPA